VDAAAMMTEIPKRTCMVWWFKDDGSPPILLHIICSCGEFIGLQIHEEDGSNTFYTIEDDLVAPKGRFVEVIPPPP